nr:Protein W02B12.13, isoform a [Haemonchus contortus]
MTGLWEAAKNLTGALETLSHQMRDFGTTIVLALFLIKRFIIANKWRICEAFPFQWPAEEERRDFSREPTRKVQTTTPYYEEIDPNRNGLLKDIGSINVGFGVGVGVPGNDPVKVGARVGVGFGESGLAGQLPIGQDIYPRQGQFQSLNDYDGDKSNIVPDRARKYWQAVREGRIRIPHYRPAASLVGVGGNVGIGTAV